MKALVKVWFKARAGSPNEPAVLVLIEFSNGWFKFLDLMSPGVGPFDRPADTVDHLIVTGMVAS